jgi:murein DD-endopeptidase MepM/ murein hydrolase activator NlpD
MTGAGILRRYAPAASLLMATLCAGVSPCSAGTRLYPVDGGSVTSGQGWRIDPFGSGRWVFHRGLDIAVPVGTPVHPTQIGTVIFTGDYKGYGKLVVVEHGSGYITLYGHNSEIRVASGQKVDTSTVLARSGNTGRSTGPHVHYEVRRLQEQPADEMRSELEGLVRKRIDGWVGSIVAGQGDGESAGMQTVPERSRPTPEPPGLVP